MWFVYFDESKHNNSFFVYSALILDSDQWNVAFEGIKQLRRDLRHEHGIYMRQELHAWKFAAGKGQIADRPILKAERADIFRRLLTFAANPQLFKVISSVNTDEFYGFDRVINRINRTAERMADTPFSFAMKARRCNSRVAFEECASTIPSRAIVGSGRKPGRLQKTLL